MERKWRGGGKGRHFFITRRIDFNQRFYYNGGSVKFLKEEDMKTTLSIIKADIGSIGGHIRPSEKLVAEVKNYVGSKGKGILTDFFISHTGDDIAILFSHTLGKGSEKIHQLAWDAFLAGTKVAKEQGLYGARQNFLKDSFSGNVKGMGPAVAEMEFEERPNEPFLFLAADKNNPGAYNLPLYLAFADPMYNAGLIISPKMNKGFKFVIMDVNNTEGDRVIELNAPEEIYDIAALLRDNQRFVIESIYSRNTGEIGASVSTSRLHNIAGKYTGKDAPVMLVRVQGAFPSMDEVLALFNIGHYVAGFMSGRHTAPLMPVQINLPTSYFDGPPVVVCHALCVHDGNLTETADAFDHLYWERVRWNKAQRIANIRQSGFSYLYSDKGCVRTGLVGVFMSFSNAREEVFSAIKDECSRAGLCAKRVDENPGSPDLNQDIKMLIESSDFNIFDFSEERPNVYYEFGIADTVGKPVLLIAKRGTKIHSDAYYRRINFYRTTEHLRSLIASYLREKIPGRKSYIHDSCGAGNATLQRIGMRGYYREDENPQPDSCR